MVITMPNFLKEKVESEGNQMRCNSFILVRTCVMYMAGYSLYIALVYSCFIRMVF